MQRWPTSAGALALGLMLGIAGSKAEQGGGDKIEVVASHKLPNVPGKSITAVRVSYAP
jgi:hypothetical protein